MRVKKMWKRIAAIAMSATMLLGLAMTTQAAPTIDPAQTTGNLTIHKQKSDTEAGAAGAGIDGVTFNYVNVGDFVLTGANNVNGFRITHTELEAILLANDLTAVTTAPVDPDDETAGTYNIYDGAAIQEALRKAVATPATRTTIEGYATGVFGTTANGGIVSMQDMPIGIYLFAETDAPKEVEMGAPFLLTLPTLGVDGTGAQTWVYNVDAYPKNDYTGEPATDKKFVDEEGNALVDENGDVITDLSEMIGEAVDFEINAEIPATNGDLHVFTFKDTMTAGLTYNGITGVYWMDKDAESDEITYTEFSDAEAALYTVAPTQVGGQNLTVTFIPDALQAAAATGSHYGVAVRYSALLNADAIVAVTGTDTNTNSFQVQYGNDADAVTVADTVSVDTYGFTLQKNNEASKALAEAEFKLYATAESTTAIEFYTALNDDKTVDETSKTDTAKTGTDGQVSFYGLKEGTYFLEETKAPTGYNLLKDRVAVEVSADSTGTGVDITIVNTKGFTLPSTGGMGTVLFTVGGIVIMLGAAVLLIRANKKGRA